MMKIGFLIGNMSHAGRTAGTSAEQMNWWCGGHQSVGGGQIDTPLDRRIMLYRR